MPHSTEQPVDLSELGTGTGPSTTLSRGSGGKRTRPEPRRLRLSDTCFSFKDGVLDLSANATGESPCSDGFVLSLLDHPARA